MITCKKTVLFLSFSGFIWIQGVVMGCNFTGSSAQIYLEQKVQSPKGIYIWSTEFEKYENSFLLDYLLSKKIQKVYISLGPDSDLESKATAFNDEAREKELQIELLIGNNHLVFYENRKEDFKNMVQRARELGFQGLHLDVEPHTFDDWDQKRTEYKASYLGMLEAVYQIVNQHQLLLTVSIPHFYSSIIDGIVNFADSIVVMAYKTTDTQTLYNRISIEKEAAGDKLLVALRPQDFQHFEHFKTFINDLYTDFQIESIVVHDLKTLIEIDE
jgi:hypothetical protein